MAARRLLIVMLILLGISSVLAIALPKPDRSDPTPDEPAVTGSSGATGTTGASGTTGAAGPGLAAGGKPATGGGTAGKRPGRGTTGPGETRHETVQLETRKPVEINANPGSRLVLTVKSREGSLVEIEGLGLTGFADPYAPAVFDVILPPDPGSYRIRAPEGKPVAVINARS